MRSCTEGMRRRAIRLGVAAALTLGLLALSFVDSPALAAPQGGPPAKDKAGKAEGGPSKQAPVKLGLSLNDPKAFQGYTLLAPMTSTKTYLIDMQGRVVRTWESDCTPALCAYLLENGNLLRPGTMGKGKGRFGGDKGDKKGFGGDKKGFGPGAGGRVQEFTWDGELVWDFKFGDDKRTPHHDITRLPNGNILMIVWDRKTSKEAIAAGRRPETVSTHLLPDSLVEIKKTGKTTGEVVWEWHLWDHLVQDHDPSKANYGKVAEHPELVDINYTGQDVVGAIAAKKGGLDKLKGIGYVGGPMGKGRNPDWTHFNAVAYNADLDQIVVSVHAFSEIWVIDHSTTTAEAASHKGGRSGKGGDLLYRWGNPRTYRAGTAKEQRLFAQHSAHWIPKGLPGAGNLLVFNNGGRRPDGNYSSVDELVLPVDKEGNYTLKPGKAYGPEGPAWSYSAPKKSDFFSMLISGAQRLPNGNTLICSGINGTVFEVTADKKMVWKYINPSKGGFGPGGIMVKGPGGKGPGGKGPGGFPFPGGGPPQPGQVLPPFLQAMLELTADQKKQLGEIQKGVTGKLNEILTDEQNKQFKDARPGFGPGGFGAPPRPGQIMSPFLQARLKLTDKQKEQLEGLQKNTDTQLDKLLGDEQRKQLKGMRRFAGGGFGPGGPGGMPGFGPPGGASLFRASRYAADYPGLRGRDLTPGKTIEELEAKNPKGK
jgi:hypothetical protein